MPDVPSNQPPPDHGPVFDGAAIRLHQHTRFNPLRMLDPISLSMALDAFDGGQLRQAALLWDAMTRRDDTLPSVKFLREESCASQDWQVLKIGGAPEPEASRHAAALEYFYANVTAVNAFDRNERGGYERLVDQQMSAASYRYAVHHIRWRPQPGISIPVEGASPVPALTAELEFVPLWFFENTTGLLRFLREGGFGVDGEDIDWESGEWMSTVGPGVMFAGSIAYMFKRLTFQDWTIFNERYAQGKVLGRTKEARDSKGGQAMSNLVASFNGDMGAAIFGDDGTIKDPVSIIEPKGNSADVFEKFVDRQDRKIAVLYRGSDLSTMSRGGSGEQPVGASVQGAEGERIAQADIRMIEGSQQHFLDRQIIRFVFGENVKPLAYRGVPQVKIEDVESVRENAGFIADRGGKVALGRVADRLGVTLAGEGDDALLPAAKSPVATPPVLVTANAAPAPGPDDASLGTFLAAARIALDGGIGDDFGTFGAAVERVIEASDADMDAAFRALLTQLPVIYLHLLSAPRTESAFADILAPALVDGLSSQKTPPNETL